MPDSVPSDHDSVATHRAKMERSGGTRRPCLRLPDGVNVEAGDLIRLVLDGSTRHARVEADTTGRLVRGAFDNRRLARSGREGENRLVEWAERHDRGPGTAVELDEVEAGFLYGLRTPGKRTVYEVTESPDDSLASIAESLSAPDTDSDGTDRA